MQCPRCQGPLTAESFEGLEIDRCQKCHGLWLDYPEMDELEDKAMASDELKGTMIYSPHPAGIHCPRCGKEMTTFYYRANPLQIEYCDAGHGFWLDRGEEKSVLDFMRQRVRDLRRSAGAEVGWNRMLARGGRRSLMEKVRDFLSGR